MWRIFCPESSQHFETFTEPEIRFRQPEIGSPIQCRLWKNPLIKEKWASYEQIRLVGDDINKILLCPVIWDWWECPHGWWCHQLAYTDTRVKRET